MLFNLENYKNTKIILTDKYLIFIGPLGILKRKTNFYNINIIKGKLLLDNTNYNDLFKYICKDSIYNKTKLNLININTTLPNTNTKKGLNIYTNSLKKDLQGVNTNYTITLKLNGIGFKYAIENNNTLLLRLGYSHYINYKLPQNIYIKQINDTEFMLFSNDYNLLHKTAAHIRSFKKPNFYKGSGIVYNDEIIVVRLLVNNQIVYGTTVLIAHWAVSRTTVLQIRVVVRQHVIQELQSLLALNQNLSHMGNVEQAALRPNCHMFLLDTGFVLNRQQKTTEVHDASTVLHMGVIKGCFFSFHFCTSIRTSNSFPILSFTKSAVNTPNPLVE